MTQVSDSCYGTLYSKSGWRFIKPDAIYLFLPQDEYMGYVEVEYVDEGRVSDCLYERKHLQKKINTAYFLMETIHW